MDNKEELLPSVFDGWDNKIEHRAYDGCGGFCAGGWIAHKTEQLWDGSIYDRIGRYIQKTMNPPHNWYHKDGCLMYPAINPVHAIIWANNEKLLDIEGFKQVDRCSQIEEKREELKD